ncbi:MAG TPA: Gfo/Idh/MocA family oxidoreductase [Anaerolineaceae bacterium]|nr:Gfo/Idh/MocA family oxidoreductase [Anaerolineaceae bacterium]
MLAKVKVGIIGCGNISHQYIQNMKTFDILDVKSVSDIDMEKADKIAAEYDLKSVSADELYSDPEIQIVVNLTIPSSHTDISIKTIEAGKSIYNEKPLAISRADAGRILEAAHKKGVLVGSAPDNFLGGSLQTCRKLIDDSWIGTPVAATAFFATHGPEDWHPNPAFYYEIGAGPLFDLGPYSLTALVSLFGPARRVTGSARISFPERSILSQPLYGEIIKVDVPTHVAGVIDFVSGPVASIIASFDIRYANQPLIEIYGAEGTLSLPGPNKFAGSVLMRRIGAEHWSEVPLTHTTTVGRGIGVADMAYALTSGRKHRASGELAFHVLDLMHAIIEASDRGEHVMVESGYCEGKPFERPTPIPVGLRPQELDM